MVVKVSLATPEGGLNEVFTELVSTTVETEVACLSIVPKTVAKAISVSTDKVFTGLGSTTGKTEVACATVLDTIGELKSDVKESSTKFKLLEGKFLFLPLTVLLASTLLCGPVLEGMGSLDTGALEPLSRK